jgi:hypothetical protein
MYKTFQNIGNNVVEESCGPYSRESPSSYTGYTGHTGHRDRDISVKNIQSSNANYSGHSGHSGHFINPSNDEGPSLIRGSLGVYSGDEPLPFNNDKLYNVSGSYRVMEERDKSDERIHFISSLGLYAMPDYKLEPNPVGGAPGYQYVQDGRVVDAPRGIRMILDQPAKVGAVNMDQVSTFDNSNYGGRYKTYSDIRNGQIAYYINEDVAQPFFNPVYTVSSYVDKTIRVDPMDSVKPEYIRKPISSTMHSVSKDQSTRDALSFREDLMSRQQNLYNRTSWTNRWINA